MEDDEFDVDVSDLTAAPASAAAPARMQVPAALAAAMQADPNVQQFMNHVAAKARASGRAAVQRQPRGQERQQQQHMSPEMIAQISASTVKAMLAAQTPPAPAQTLAPAPAPAAELPRPATAPSAPSGHGLPMQNGIIDLFSMTPEQLDKLGPMAVRQSLESLEKIAHDRAGMPARPRPPRNGLEWDPVLKAWR